MDSSVVSAGGLNSSVDTGAMITNLPVALSVVTTSSAGFGTSFEGCVHGSKSES